MFPIAFMTGGPGDWIVIAVVALLLFGPKKLPEVGKQIGQAMREFNKVKDELMGVAHSVHEEVQSVYEPIVKPYSDAHSVSSPTVNSATARRTYDQDPKDLMAAAVPEAKPVSEPQKEDENQHLLTANPIASVPETAVNHEKGI